MLALALGLAAAVLAVVAALLLVAGRSRARALADDVRVSIEPYLRRRAAEKGWPPEAPTWTKRSTPEEIVTWSARLSTRLLDHERDVPSPGTTDPALARTQPVDSIDALVDTGTSTAKYQR